MLGSSKYQHQQDFLADVWQEKLFGIVVSQLVLSGVVAIILFFMMGWLISASLLFGSVFVVVNSLLLAKSVRSSSQQAVSQLKMKMFSSAVGRFVLLIGVLLLANALGLHLLAVAAGMFAAYVGGYGYMIKFISEAVRASEEGRG